MAYPVPIHVSKTIEKLIKLLPTAEQAKIQVILLAGAVTPYRNDTDREMSFRQESNFYYLSGCNIPGFYLVLVHDPNAAASSNQGPLIKLFIPEIVPADLMWSVPPPTLAEATRLFPYASATEYTSSLATALNSIIHLASNTGTLIHTLPLNSPLFPNLSPEYTKLVSESSSAEIKDEFLLTALHHARLIKTEYEVEEIRKANAISSRAHEVVMRMLGRAIKGLIRQRAVATQQPLLPHEWLIEKEAEAEAVFVASCRREGSVHQAYMPIVAASVRAATLHYCCNDKDFAWGPVGAHDHQNSGSLALVDEPRKTLKPQVLLIDAGCEWNNYASDITRTMPVGNGGKFTSEARAIYELVLEMQRASLDFIKPGIHWDTVQLLCHRVLVRGFQRLGIFHSRSSGSWNSEESILASGVSAAFFPHGVGHSLGMDVHDVPSASKPSKNDTIEKWRREYEDETKESVVDNRAFYEYLRLRLPLEEGMVVTVEPGIYFHPHLLASVRDSRHINYEILKRYESGGGVRIEDVVLITGNGHENLTTVGKEIDWVEGVCSGEL